MKKIILLSLFFLLFFSLTPCIAKTSQLNRNTIFINGMIVDADIFELKKIFSDSWNIKDWNIEICSSGGMSDVGVGIYNTIKSESIKGKTFTTITMSVAESMGAIIFLAGDIRIAYEGSQIMFHKAYIANQFGIKIPPPPGSDIEKMLKLTNEFFTKLLEPILGNEIAKLEKDIRLTAKEAKDLGIATVYISNASLN